MKYIISENYGWINNFIIHSIIKILYLKVNKNWKKIYIYYSLKYWTIKNDQKSLFKFKFNSNQITNHSMISA